MLGASPGWNLKFNWENWCRRGSWPVLEAKGSALEIQRFKAAKFVMQKPS
jgi:hypothetical protein